MDKINNQLQTRKNFMDNCENIKQSLMTSKSCHLNINNTRR